MSGVDMPRRASDEPFTFRGSVPGGDYLDGAGLLQDDRPEHDGGRCHSNNGSPATDATANGADAAGGYRDNGTTKDHAKAAGENRSGPQQRPIWVDSNEWSESDIPRRPWVAPGYALLGSVTLVSGPPSAMKSSVMLAWACSVALEKSFGRFNPVVVGPVVVYNVEDDRNEQRRRLSATLRQFEASPADIRDRVIRVGPSTIGTLFVRDDAGRIRPTAAMEAMEELIKQTAAVMLVVDPLSELHNVEENDNTAIRAVIAAFRDLAAKYEIAVVILHHTSKARSASPGDPDAARGASAIVGAVRVAVTLNTMSEDDAKAFGLPTEREKRSNYVRMDDAKSNYAPLRDAQWFEKLAYGLANGEHVPAAVPWEPPEPKVASLADLGALAAAIERGSPNGEPWSPRLGKEPRSIQALLAEYGFIGDAVKATITTLEEEFGLSKGEYRRPNRKKAIGLRIGAKPAADWIDKPASSDEAAA